MSKSAARAACSGVPDVRGVHRPNVSAASASVVVAVRPVTVSRAVAASMLGVSLAHFERWIQPSLRLVYCGSQRLVPVGELERWAERNTVDPMIGGPR